MNDARSDEVQYRKSRRLRAAAEESECWEKTGRRLPSIKWVGTDKGVDNHPLDA